MNESAPPKSSPNGVTIPEKLLLNTERETTGSNNTDTDTVRKCLADAVKYFHDHLPDDTRTHITEKWGINDDMIDSRRIGFVDDSNDVIHHLREEGYSSLTIARAGLGSVPAFKHVFGCDGVTETNEHIAPTDDCIADCSHSVPESIDRLVAARVTGEIDGEDIDVRAVAECIEEQHDAELFVGNWWDHRITFPYRDADGEFCYVIARATEETSDIIHDNGITDMSGEYVRTVGDTQLCRELSIPEAKADEFIVAPQFEAVFQDPYSDEHRDAATKAGNTIEAFVNSDAVTDAGLHSIGVTHEPEMKEEAVETRTTRVVIRNTEQGDDVVVSPTAIGVEPGANIEFVNRTDSPVTVDVIGTPAGVWWDGTSVPGHGSAVKECSEAGMYKYTITSDDSEEVRAAAIVYNTVYTERRNKRLEKWLDWRPSAPDEIPKYVKQTIDRPWVDRDAVVEPIFGRETVHEGEPLVVTEGVTDAVMAHQHGFPCVAPATTNFKQHHYDVVCELAELASAVFVVNDNEENAAGANGALRTAKVIGNDGHNVRVGVLPRQDDVDKIDVADFLHSNTRSAFLDVLREAVPAEQHEQYDAERHDPSYNAQPGTDTSSSENGSGSRDTGSEPGGHDVDFESSNASAIYSLELRDVIDFDGLDTGTRTGSTIYRGPNPIQHHGNSTGYFVIRDHGDYVTAKDFKIESSGDGYYYNALTWLACAASCRCDDPGGCGCTRSTRRPMGSLQNSEVWWAWQHAKTADHIPMPSEDRVPMKAVWFLASYHDAAPDSHVPESFDDERRLPATAFNSVLRIIKEEYGLDPGRSER